MLIIFYNVELKPIYFGYYYHFDLKNAVLSLIKYSNKNFPNDTQKIELNVNIDKLSLSNSLINQLSTISEDWMQLEWLESTIVMKNHQKPMYF